MVFDFLNHNRDNEVMNAQTYVAALLKSGLTQSEIAEQIGVGQSYVSALSRGIAGKRLGYTVGKALESLWREKCQPLPAPVPASAQQAVQVGE
jgi:hypothetical protein